MNEVDVAILGGGLAGNLLARQLRREVPGASVALFEKSEERRYKVGESTVEIATNYLVRKQGLSTYIYKEHLPKNGLRYFFDTPEMR
ncbi:MAG TPA: tryptophan 7-halogenase, partial [Polyangiaceae bacterium LLY-WYZ-15_(1-7)]|nr:tryptophan 7-halogenase [Polyangiaceae bacterium LLY-WYZ-15_(1-7)]